MKAKILTNDPSLIVMFRLGSIEGTLVNNSSDMSLEFKEAIKDDNLAVLILTTTTKAWIEKEVRAHRESESVPLIVVIDG